MCGIAGVVSVDPADTAAISSTASLLRHRGPDDRGFAFWDGTEPVVIGRDPHAQSAARVSLIHQRLSILDLTEAGWQPMLSPDRGLVLVFNGEIYNFKELRADLERQGHRFRSSGDTEVLLAAWTEWGPACLPRLVGMYAIAVLDTRRRRLTIARDPFGIKPLYYTSSPGRASFASEIPALLDLAHLAPRADAQTVADYLRFGLTDHGAATFFRDINAVLPGELVEIGVDTVSLSVKRWYDPDPSPLDLSFSEAAAQLRDLFVDSVNMHLRSDVPIGFALSGGIDSSAIACAARAIAGDGASLHAFSYIAADPTLSELSWVEQAAAAARTTVTQVAADEKGLVDNLQELIASQAEPFGTTSIFAQRQVFRAARENGVIVMLDGQGADELFAGYSSLIPGRFANLMRHGRVAEALRLARSAGRSPDDLGMGWHLSRGLVGAMPTRVADLINKRRAARRTRTLLSSNWLNTSGIEAVAPTRARSLSEALDDAFHRTSLPSLLRYEDRNSMAFSLESRVPFLDPRVVEFTQRLPEHYLVDDAGVTKSVFRSAMRGLVPDAILDRRDKIGFETPEHTWLVALRPWVEETLRSPAAHELLALDVGAVSAEYRDIVEGRRPFGWHLWRCLNLIRWTEVMSVTWD